MPPSEWMSGPTRTTPIVLLAIAGLLLAARIGVGVHDALSPESRPELVEWTTPAEAAQSERASGHLMLYAFTDRTQAASRKLASDLFAGTGTANAINKDFVPVRIEGDPAAADPETAALRSKFGVTKLPALVVATADGAKFKTITDPANAREAITAIKRAQMEVMGLPFEHGRGFRFQVGNRGASGGSIGGAPEPGAEADSVGK